MINYHIPRFLVFCCFVVAVVFLIALVKAVHERSVCILKKRAVPLLIMLAVLSVTFMVVNAHVINAEAEWGNYIQHFGSPSTGTEALLIYGEPRQTDKEFDNNNRVIYTWLHYDGYSFGIPGDTDRKICAVRVTGSDIIPLHGGIDIGSSLAEVEATFVGITKIKEGRGYIFRHPGEYAHDGIWLYLEYDDNDKLVEYTITNGF